MMGEALDLLVETADRQPLHRRNDTRVEMAPALAQQAAVGDFVGERVLEGVDELPGNRVAS